jgi:sugar lactone lactonase YvrE
MGIENNTTLAFEPLCGTTAELGESPVWSAADNAVWWVDIPGKRLHRTDAGSGDTQSWNTPEFVGFVALAEPGGVVLGLETGLFAFDRAGGHFECLIRLGDEGVRFNDATTDDAGRLWASTMDIDNARPVGKLLRIDPDMTVSTVLTGLRTPNGLAVDGERSRLYVSDSHPDIQTVWSADLDLADGTMGERRVFARFDGLAGRPDGAALDKDGNYWIAGVGGGCLHVFSPEGGPITTFATPMESPTKMAFGRDRIFLTSKAGDGDGGRLVSAPTATRGSVVSPFGLRAALVSG